ncbi:hypothetical protein AI2826V1_4805, partial (plasmid) [Citrobacter freundii]
VTGVTERTGGMVSTGREAVVLTGAPATGRGDNRPLVRTGAGAEGRAADVTVVEAPTDGADTTGASVDAGRITDRTGTG